MPNILVEDSNSVMRYSLVIKLKDGCVILWDGTNICHCTSMRIDPKCPSKRYGDWVHKYDMYGFHFINSAGNLKHIKESCENKYNLIMGDDMGKFNWEAFVKVKYPEEEYYW